MDLDGFTSSMWGHPGEAQVPPRPRVPPPIPISYHPPLPEKGPQKSRVPCDIAKVCNNQAALIAIIIASLNAISKGLTRCKMYGI